jgi:hypothetical protein
MHQRNGQFDLHVDIKYNFSQGFSTYSNAKFQQNHLH